MLRAEGVTDFSVYQHPEAQALAADFFVPDAVLERTPTRLVRGFE